MFVVDPIFKLNLIRVRFIIFNVSYEQPATSVSNAVDSISAAIVN